MTTEHSFVMGNEKTIQPPLTEELTESEILVLIGQSHDLNNEFDWLFTCVPATYQETHHFVERTLYHCQGQGSKLKYPGDEPTDISKQPIRTRYLGHVTFYQPIRDQYFLIRSVPAVSAFSATKYRYYSIILSFGPQGSLQL
eukprot:sb/3474186/